MATSGRWFADWTIIGLSTAVGAMAQVPEPDLSSDAAKEFQAYAKGCAAAYDIQVQAQEGEPRQLALTAEPILRWTNPLAGRQAHGEVFLWTDDGRPTAVLSLYQWTAPDKAVHEHHEFCSLATASLATAGPEKRDWSPQAAGVQFLTLPESPVPADSPRLRLIQLKDLAARFTAEKTTREDQEVRDLRLLARPIQRYESKQNDVIDGALFAFVEHTDPEIFLILEARLAGGKSEWQYACVRMNSLRLAVALDGKSVWEAEQLPWREALNRPDLPYTAFTIR
ncbi:MAG TPA: hypothetical protein VFV87_20500 [Pirellulaceae bacterium]|nr:hypothetical protein [Pirellulaceae bacterium]